MPAIPTGIPAVGGGEWSVGSVGGLGRDGAVDAVQPTGNGPSFGSLLGKSLQSLQASQDDAAQASQALADGTATDPSAVVMAVERARLAMQLAAQLRTKGVEAINDVMHTQV